MPFGVTLAVAVGLLGWVGSVVFLAVRRFDFMSNSVVAGWIALQVVGTSAAMFILASVFRNDESLVLTFGALACLSPILLVLSGVVWTYAVRAGLEARAAQGLPLPPGVNRERALTWGQRRQRQ